MRGILVTPAVTACAALTLPLLAPASYGAAPHRAAGPERRPPAAVPAAPAGATHSLPLVPLGTPRRAYGTASGTSGAGLPAQEVRPFSLIGIVWDDADTELHGRVQVRTRSTATRAWSGWQDIQAHDDDRPDPDSDEGRHSKVHGSTAPLWVGASDAVQVRVRPEPEAGRQPAGHGGGLPRGMRAELVDPGRDPAPAPAGAHGRRSVTPPGPVPGGDNEGSSSASAANAPLAPLGATEIPAAERPDSQRDVAAAHIGIGRITADWNTEDPETQDAPETTALSQDTASIPLSPETDRGAEENNADDSESAGRYVGPRPRIVTRAGWGADESMRERQFAYTKTVKAAFVHHTASGNGYSCSEASSVIRGIYRYHVVSSGWRDIGYNFLVDKCGTVYEGRAGGVAKAVKGAHTLGFNTNSMGIAVVGTFSKNSAPGAAVDAVAKLAAWKLGLFGINPRGSASLVSGGGNLYKKGTTVKIKAISGHRDGYATECPGDKLYSRLGTIRSTAARLQGR